MSPSGKAPGFGPGIRGFESLHPSQIKTPKIHSLTFLFGYFLSPILFRKLTFLVFYGIILLVFLVEPRKEISK